MALIKCKNADLYRDWIEYLCWRKGLKDSTAEIRTEAFFKSTAGENTPMIR